MRARSPYWQPVLLLSILIAVAVVTVPTSANPQQTSQPFPVAELFLELNDTDGDLGIHANLDGGGWTNLEIEGPRERLLLGIAAKGSLRRQALTQLSFESTEPTFDELEPAELFRRFPEGEYEIEARSQSGGTLASTVRLSHVLAAPVEALVSGLPAAESCDAAQLPEVAGPVVVDWEPVTHSHPDIGKTGAVTISRYQFFVQQGDTKLSLDLLPDATEFEIPTSITAARGVFKFEIIARTSTGNNTAIESCFRVP